MTHSERFISTRLTFDDYRDWRLESDQDESELSIRNSFAFYSESDFILDNFQNLREILQVSVDFFMLSGCAVADIETWMELCLRLQVEHQRALDRADSVTKLRSDLHCAVRERFDEHEQKIFFSASAKVLKQCRSSYGASNDYAGVSHVFTNALSAYALLEDSTTVFPVLLKWVESSTLPGTISDLISVSREWDTVKDMPLDWAVNYVRGSEVSFS